MKFNDSFKKPGAVPFKWEIRPGVPKLHDPQKPQHEYRHDPQNVQQEQFRSPKLKPPPAGFYFNPDQKPSVHSFRSAPQTPSRRFGMTGPGIVSSGRCFLSPLLWRKHVKKAGKSKARARAENEYYSELEASSRWSVSSRRSGSPLSYSFPSDQSPPHQMSEVEWAALTLF